jgi:hypothetical protein
MYKAVSLFGTCSKLQMVRASPELPRADEHRSVWSLGKLKTRRHYTPTPHIQNNNPGFDRGYLFNLHSLIFCIIFAHHYG